MPIQCPKNKLNYYDCILCSDNREGYCWGLCPPKECKRSLREIISLEERVNILEDRLDNRTGIDDITIDNLANIQKDVEHRLEEFQKLITLFQGKFQYLNTLSKKIVTLEESSKSKGTKKDTYKIT